MCVSSDLSLDTTEVQQNAASLHDVVRNCDHPVAPIPLPTHALTSPSCIDAICVYAHNQGQTKSTQPTYQEISCVAFRAKQRAESCLACWCGCRPGRLRVGPVKVAEVWRAVWKRRAVDQTRLLCRPPSVTSQKMVRYAPANVLVCSGWSSRYAVDASWNMMAHA